MKFKSYKIFLVFVIVFGLLLNGCASTLTPATTTSTDTEATTEPEVSTIKTEMANNGPVKVYAEKYLQISEDGLQLEGPAFDRDGNLFIVEVFGGRIFKISPDKTITTILEENSYSPAAIDIHKDGRLFVSGLGDFVTGSLFTINPDGSGYQEILSPEDGYLVDDMVFDSEGGIYFTDFNGYSTNLTGGAYYISPDYQTVTPILKNLGIANGIALSPSGKTLYVTEFANNRLHAVNLLDDHVTIAPFGATVPYYFDGMNGPDSMIVDDQGNMYIAMYPQGKINVINPKGELIGVIIIPESEDGHMMRTTSMAFFPGTNQLVITTNDWDGGQGSWLYTCEGFGSELPFYSHQ